MLQTMLYNMYVLREIQCSCIIGYCFSVMHISLIDCALLPFFVWKYFFFIVIKHSIEIKLLNVNGADTEESIICSAQCSRSIETHH